MSDDNQLRRFCLNYARQACANNVGGQCLPRDEPCFAFIPPAQVCTYFIRAVAPMNPRLSSIFREVEGTSTPSGLKLCNRCKKPFTPSGNRQRFCTACGAIEKRIQAARRKRKQRANVTL